MNCILKRCLGYATNSVAKKTLKNIPGPLPIPLLGSSWKYFPFIGNYRLDRLHKTGALKLKEYGPIVKEEISPGFFIVHVFDPEDIEQVYKSEGKYPSRRSHLALLDYRLSRPHLYNSGGLLPVNGTEWWRLRSTFQKSLSRIKDVRSFLPPSEKIVDDFFNKLIISGEPVPDFLPLVSRLNLELIWMAMFGKRLGCFEEAALNPDSTPTRLMEAAETVNCCTLVTDSTEQIWKKFKTPLYLKMEKCLTFIESVILPELLKTKDEPTTNKCLINQYMESEDVDFKDICGMAIDLILGGIDTTSYTSSFLLYHLSNSESAQKKLKDETSVLLKDSEVTTSVINEAVYSRAILKETFRLNPIAVGISRILDKDTELSGYLVPKGTLIITQNMVACRQEKHFKNPDKFVPERWVKDSDEYTSVSPYLILPFSHGTRTCIARRLAEQNLLMLILKIGHKYDLKWLGDKELSITTPLICKPAIPIKLVFNKRN